MKVWSIASIIRTRRLPGVMPFRTFPFPSRSIPHLPFYVPFCDTIIIYLSSVASRLSDEGIGPEVISLVRRFM